MKRAAVEKLYDEHAEGLFRFALSLVRNPEDARDLLQDVFVRLARNEGVMDGVADPRAFLFRMARNGAIDRSRRIGVRRRGGERLAGEIQLFAPSADPDVAAFREGVANALSTLPEDQRTVVYLKLWEGLTFQQVAEVCAVSANTAASRYRYGIEKLREHLRPILRGDQRMSSEWETRFQDRLGELPRLELPEQYRDEILANACGDNGDGTLLIRMWKAAPKPVVVAIAAAWIAVGILNLTTPEVDQRVAHVSQPAVEEIAQKEEEPARQLAAWIELRRSLENL